MTVTAIVLAAGQGSRFRAEAGQDKLLAACVGLDGVTRPVIEQVLLNLPTRIVRRWVVTLPERHEVIRLARAYGCEVLLLESAGMGDSLASAFSAIVVYAQELVPGNVGMIAGIFFGLMFGFGGIGAALLGHLADIHGIEYVYKLCSYLPLFGVLAIFLPRTKKV